MSIRLRIVIPLALLCLAVTATSTLGEDWKPIAPDHMALKAALVEKDADAEALFWEVRVDDNPEGDLIFTHYIRIKVFTERGRESQSKIDINFGKLFGNEIRIKDIEARTIKPDGTIIVLKKEDVFERTIVRASGLKVKAKSFALPGIEPGSIIEYRWREVRVNQNANYVRLEFQRDIPVQRVKYLIKPFPYSGYSMRSITLHGANSQFQEEKNGFYSTTMERVPALHEEYRMPPENQIKAWMLIYYTKDDKLDADKYWLQMGKRYYEAFKPYLKVNDEIRQASVTAVADGKTDDEKIDRLYAFCRARIKNVSDDASGLTAEERKKLKENKSPADTLKRGVGTSQDIDLLFAALATAAGYDARVVLAPDRGDLFFDKTIPNDYFLEPSNIALKVGETWRFFNPGLNYVPAGMLRWQEEEEDALITDSKQPVWVRTPLSPPDKSLVKRVGKFKLSEDGTLEGTVHLEYTGHLGIERKEENDDDSPSKREENLRDEVKARLSTAEVADIQIENVTDPIKPFVYSFTLRIPGYAQRTGKRLFLQPAVFQKGAAQFFSTSERKYPIYFHYPWSEKDEITIELPAGFALDNAEAPAPFNAGAISAYKPYLGATSDGRTLIFKRNFFFGGGGNILFPAGSYAQLKQYFDQLQKQDAHTVSLKSQ